MITPDYTQIAETVLSMPETDRAELAALLFHSLDERLPVGQRRTAEEWVDEIRNRSDELHLGDSPLIDSEEALARMRTAIDSSARSR